MSILSWAIILQKFFVLRTHKKSNAHFTLLFQKKQKISELLSLSNKFPHVINSEMFMQIYGEYSGYRNRLGSKSSNSYDLSLICNSMERGMQSYIMKRSHLLEKNIPILASISSSAPFVGLLGTVLGITLSFSEIAKEGATNLSIVAPGISEALIATAFGLFAAIPSLISYNYFKNQIRSLTTEVKIFGIDLINKLIVSAKWDS